MRNWAPVDQDSQKTVLRNRPAPYGALVASPSERHAKRKTHPEVVAARIGLRPMGHALLGDGQRQKLSTPQSPPPARNPNKPNPFHPKKTWHTHPSQLGKLEVEN